MQLSFEKCYMNTNKVSSSGKRLKLVVDALNVLNKLVKPPLLTVCSVCAHGGVRISAGGLSSTLWFIPLIIMTAPALPVPNL